MCILNTAYLMTLGTDMPAKVKVILMLKAIIIIIYPSSFQVMYGGTGHSTEDY